MISETDFSSWGVFFFFVMGFCRRFRSCIYSNKQMRFHSLARNSWKFPTGFHRIRALSGGGAFIPRASGLVRQVLGSNRLFVRPGHRSGQLPDRRLWVQPNGMQWRRSHPAGDSGRVHDRLRRRRTGLLRRQFGGRIQHSDGGGRHGRVRCMPIDGMRGGLEPAVPEGATLRRRDGV